MKIRKGGLVGLIVSAIALGMSVSAPTAAAANHEFLTRFGEGCHDSTKISQHECGGAAGETIIPMGVVTDPDTGHVFVVDLFNSRIDEFTPWGGFVKAFGWDVSPGPVDEEQELRVRAAAGQFKLGFGAETTGDLPFDAGEAEVKAALDGLVAIDSVTVTKRLGNPNGSTPYVYVIRFGGTQAGTDVAQLTAADGSTPLGGGDPTTALEVHTRADGGAAGAGLESCTAKSACKTGSEGAGSGQFAYPAGIAMDSNHDLYVADKENHRVEKFDSAGHFLLMFGDGVDQTTGSDVCTATSGHTCGAGSEGTGTGEFSMWNLGSSIAVGSGDTVYVGDRERIQKFDTSGNPVGEIPLPGKGTVSALAVAPSGNIWVSFNNVNQSGFPANPDVLELNSAGSSICTISVGRPTALGTNDADHVFVFASRVYESLTERDTSEIREYDSDCQKIAGFAENEFDSPGTNGGGPFGMDVNLLGDVYVSNSFELSDSYVSLYGPPPAAFESPALAAPDIGPQYATSVGTNSSTLRAQINPKFWSDATYLVQYGEGDCASGGCTSTASVSLTTASINSPLTTAPVALSGLKPNTVYHYRFVSESGGGGPVFGPDRTFHTYPEVAAGLPDARAYEQVSPLDKNGGEVGVPTPAGGGAGNQGGTGTAGPQPQQASPSGDAISYASATPFGEDPESAAAASQYLSSHGPGGWSTENINPPFGGFDVGFLRDPIIGFSEDLSHAAVSAREPLLTEDALAGLLNLYWRDNASGAFTALTNEEHRPQLAVPNDKYCSFYDGASADSKRVFFGAMGGLLEGDPVAGEGMNLYESSAGEGLRLASVLPNGAPATPDLRTVFGGRLSRAISDSAPCYQSFTQVVMRHAISADGSKAFWTYFGGTYAGAKEPLFVRIEGSETIQLDHPNPGTSGAGGEGRYWDATPDGSKVLFTAPKKLTSAPTTVGAGKEDLYLYDFTAAEEGEPPLTDLTPHTPEAASAQRALGLSEDGAYAYFVAKGALTANVNSEGDIAQPGVENLYAWHAGEGLRFIATAGEVGILSSRVSPGGTALAFLSPRSLTGFDNTDATSGKADPEAFVYDYGADTLACASCNPSGSRPLGRASFPEWTVPYVQPRYLSADGTRLFFQTDDVLDPLDTNERQDVYESEAPGAGSCSEADLHFDPASGRCIYLISTGKSKDDSYFIDASVDGSGAFLSTREGLAFGDSDGAYDVYDARVGGHAREAPAPSCEGEGCRGPVSPPAGQGAPGSAGFQAPPQGGPRTGCPKGRHAVTRKGKSRCVKAKHNRKKRHGKRAGNGRKVAR